jgi:2-aminoadipate transaminase
MNTAAEAAAPQISFATGSLGNVPLLESVIREAFLHVDPRPLFFYGDPMGLPELRHLVARLHPGVDADRVMITTSVQQGLALLFEQLVRERGKILVQQPAYFGMLRLLKAHDLPVTAFEEYPQLREHVRTVATVYLTSNFHNPTGRSLTQAERQKIAKLAQVAGTVIIEDNPYDELYYGARPTTLCELVPKSTCYLGGFSKLLAPGVRVGYLIAPQAVLNRLRSGKITADLFTSPLGQQVCAAALRLGYLDELRTYFKAKRDLALIALKQYAGDTGASWTEPAGGIYIQVSLPARVPLEPVRRMAEEKYGLRLESDCHSYLDGQSRNTTRINFVQNPDALLVEGIRRFGQVLQEAPRTWN